VNSWRDASGRSEAGKTAPVSRACVSRGSDEQSENAHELVLLAPVRQVCQSE